jgi:hypothetical protein
MAEETKVTLRYLGPDVDDGSIGVDDLLSALNGFSSAFYKVAERVDLDSQQRIKVTGISQSSANIHLAILDFTQNHPKEAAAIGGAVVYVGKKLVDLVMSRISDVAKAKKHIQGGKYSVAQTGDNNRSIIINNLNVGLPVSKEVMELLRDGTIDADLEKLTSPLREEAIDGFEMRRDDEEIADLTLSVTDKPYFTKPRRAKTETKSVVMIGTLTSINKRNNSGIFVTESGRKIRYKITSDSENLPELYRKFAHLGLVRVDCIAKLDENLDVISIDISNIEPN